MGKYEVEFIDGHKVVKDANTRDDAKRAAKIERRQTVPQDTPKSAPEVKVAKVTQIE